MEKIKKAKWIWYENDFEVFTYHKMSKRRYQRKDIIYPCWAMDRPEYQVVFFYEYDVPKDTSFKITSKNSLVVNIDGNPWNAENNKEEIFLKKGKGYIRIYCFEEESFPTIFIDSEYIKTDESWFCYCVDAVMVHASCSDTFDNPRVNPADYRLPTKKLKYIATEKVGNGAVYDFGKEIVARPVIVTDTPCELALFYGESKNEALDFENSEVCETLSALANVPAKARECVGFRYLFVKDISGVKDVYVENEIYEHSFTPSFVSDDKLLNEIYKTAVYTLELTSREFFIDGPKRDRWVWAGDTLQSLWFDFYAFFDKEIVKRTLSAIIGKNEVKSNVSGILDYNFYYILSAAYYYRFTGDKEFIAKLFPRLESLMRYIFKKPTENGFLMPKQGEWFFIDWTDMKDFHKVNYSKPVSVLQILYYVSLEAMRDFAEMLGANADVYKEKLEGLREKIDETFFDKEYGGFKHDPDGELNTRYGNIAAILFGYADEEQKKIISKNAFNRDSYEIYTPYMKFYEMCVYAETGKTDYVLSYLKEYWGAMIKLGATTFWERFDPSQKGAEHYEMYGRKYGKSLCHSWGAGPVYIIGKYVVGLKEQGGENGRFLLDPFYSDLRFNTVLPLKRGYIEIGLDGKELTVFSSETDGVLAFSDKIVCAALPETEKGYFIKRGVKYSVKLKGGEVL